MWTATVSRQPAGPRSSAAAVEIDDVREENRAQDPFRVLGDAGERAHAGDVVRHPRLVADDPAIVPRRDVEDRAGPDLEGRPVLHPDPQPALEADADMVVLAEPGPGERLDVLDPVPARLEDRATDDEVVERVDVDPAERGATDLVGHIERLELQAGHGTRSGTDGSLHRAPIRPAPHRGMASPGGSRPRLIEAPRLSCRD